MNTPLQLGHDAIHLDSTTRAVPLPGFDHGYDAYIAAHCAPGTPGRLVTIEVSSESWSAWEMHPEGDEVVVVLAGRAEFVQRFPDGREVRVVVGPREAIVNPAGIPHTANVIEPMTALYITPAPGTTHEPR